MKILRKNSSETTFEENNSNLKKCLMDGGYPQSLMENLLLEIKFTKGSLNPLKNQQRGKRNIVIRDTIPALSVYYKGSLNEKWTLICKANYDFNKFLKNHQSFPYEKGKSSKDMLVRAPKKEVNRGFHARIDVRPVTLCIFSHNRFVSILAIISAGCVLYNKCSQRSR